MSYRRIRLVTAAASILVMGTAVVAWQPGTERRQPAQPAGQPDGQPGNERRTGPGGPGGPGAARRGEGSVDGAMRTLNRGMRQLTRSLEDATKKEENLQLLNEMQRACVNAKGLPVPETVLKKAQDDAAKAKLGENYRRELVKSLRLLLDIETALMDDKMDEAKAKFGELEKARDHAHESMDLGE